MVLVNYNVNPKLKEWETTFSNCYIKKGTTVRGLTKTIERIEKYGTLLLEDLTSKTASYDIWGGTACITLDGPPQITHFKVDISHENLRELYFILQRLGLMKCQ